MEKDNKKNKKNEKKNLEELERTKSRSPMSFLYISFPACGVIED